MFCLCSGDIYLSLSISSFVSNLLCGKDFEPLVILSANLFPFKSPAAYAVF